MGCGGSPCEILFCLWGVGLVGPDCGFLCAVVCLRGWGTWFGGVVGMGFVCVVLKFLMVY